jgi:Ser/Thr protein kinase RdoA (MazF antagonist)
MPFNSARPSADQPHTGSSHAFSALSPEAVLNALASIGLRGDGELTALSSYENRVYQVQLEEPHQGHRVVVAKFYRPGRWSQTQILEEHVFAAELMAAEIPMIGPLLINGHSLHQHEEFGFSVSPRRGGRPPELDDFEVLEWIGRLLGRIHSVGASHPFSARPAISLQSYALEPRAWLLAQQVVPPEVREEWTARCEQAIALIAQHPSLQASAAPALRLHGDCHPGNILWTPQDLPLPGPHFVDLDDARNGPAVQDLWMLLSGDRRQQTQQLSALLDGYEQFRSFKRSELTLIEPLRTLRLIHYSAWLARRWNEGIFQANFPWFGTPDYWRGQVHTLEEQIEAMQEQPLSA